MSWLPPLWRDRWTVGHVSWSMGLWWVNLHRLGPVSPWAWEKCLTIQHAGVNWFDFGEVFYHPPSRQLTP